MPIVVALMMLWVGTLLDMASTYFTHLDTISVDIDFVIYIILNGGILLVFSLATMLALKPLDMVKKYIRETSYREHVEGENTSKENLRKYYFVSRRVIWSVSVLVFVGSLGGVRFLFFVNNLIEYFDYQGFMSFIFLTFPEVDYVLVVAIIYAVGSMIIHPIIYLLLRLTTR